MPFHQQLIKDSVLLDWVLVHVQFPSGDNCGCDGEGPGPDTPSTRPNDSSGGESRVRNYSTHIGILSVIGALL